MRLLRVLDLALVAPRLLRHVVGPVDLSRLGSCGRQCRVGQRRRVGSHVRDVAVLVQPLGDAHRRLRREAELAARLLLQRRRHERRARTARVGLALDAPDPERHALEPLREPASCRLVEHEQRVVAQLPVRPQVPSGCDSAVVEREELRLEGIRRERRLDVPPGRAYEGHSLALPLDDESGGNRLDAAGREPAHDLLPEHGRDLVAVEPVEDPARLLRVHEPLVDPPRLGERTADRVGRDLVEDHAPDWNLRLEHLEQVPGDRLALAVFVRREQHLVGLRHALLQHVDGLLLVRVEDVERLEVLFDVHAEPRPRLLLVLGRNVSRALREVANVPDA